MVCFLIREDRIKVKELIVKKNVVVIYFQDCVVMVIMVFKVGEIVIMFIGECEISVVLYQDVLFGYKFVICDVFFYGEVYKYGEFIGCVIQEIKSGDYVYVYNVESECGCGDWK